MKNGEKERVKKVQKKELPDLLIYRKKKYIIPGVLLLFFALPLLSFVITLGIAGSAGEDMVKMLASQNLIYRIAYNFGYLLPVFVILAIPALLFYAVIRIGERRFLRIYQSMPEPAKQKLCKMKSRNLFLRGLGFYEAEGYILFHDRCVFGTPQIARIDDIVWGYLGRSDIQYSNVEVNVIMSPPVLQFFSLCFYTKDGRRHRISASMSYKEVVSWFTTRCPRAILGYGKEQKRQAKEIFRREAEQKAFLMGDEKDSYLIRKRRSILAMTAGCVLAVILLVSGIYIREYRNSDTYLYRKNMKEADRYFAEEEWSRAYQAYYKARDYRTDDEESTKGMLLSCLGMAKNDGYIDSIIRDYENLFYHQDLFTDETDISDWYFDCADYYLEYKDPLGAMELLERGMETFAREETVVGDAGKEDALTDRKKRKEASGKTEKKESVEDKEGEEEKEEQEIRKNILQKMQDKKDDILARCQIDTVTEYTYGERKKYTKYTYKGKVRLEIFYYSGKSREEYNEYDRDGNVYYRDIWETGGDKEEKINTRKEFMEYDEKGNLCIERRWDQLSKELIYTMYCRYDENGRQIYYNESHYGIDVLERECCIMTDTMQIDREYRAIYDREGGDPYSYVERKWDKKGNLLETAYYSGSYTPEKIQDGRAVAQLITYYTYDERGNWIEYHYLYEETGESYPVFEREYDEKDRLIKEVYYYGEEKEPDSLYMQTRIWHYNEEDLLVKEEWITSDGTKVWQEQEEVYTYDNAGNLIRTDYLFDGEIYYSVIKEYDVAGNQTKEYEIDGGAENVPEEARPSKEWEYQYRYMP